MPREDNLLHALIFGIVFLSISTLIGDFFGTIYIGTYVPMFRTFFIREAFVVFVTHLFVTAGNILSFTWIGAEGRYKDTFIILAYSTAIIPLEYLPIFPINVIMGIYWTHTCIRGGQFVYSLSYWKSCLIVLIGSYVLSILLAILVLEILIL